MARTGYDKASSSRSGWDSLKGGSILQNSCFWGQLKLTLN